MRLDAEQLEQWRDRARESILEVNDGIVSAAGVAEGFAGAGAQVHTLLFAGVAVILAGGLAVAGARYTEVHTEWEMNRNLIEEERASIAADPEGELAELTAIYADKGLDEALARQVAEALTAHDPVAAHADAELKMAELGTSSGAWSAAIISGLSYAIGAVVPLLAVYFLPLGERQPVTFIIVLVALGLTGWFAARLTRLPALRLILRNMALGAVTMAISIVVGRTIAL